MTNPSRPSPSPGLHDRARTLAAAARALAVGMLTGRRGRASPASRAPGPAGADLLWANGGRDGPPDLDELWRDFNRKLSGLFGSKGGGGLRKNGSGDPGGGGGPNFQPDMRSAGIGAGLIAGVVALIWLGSGFFIVQEGQQAVVTSFGKYSHTVDAGFQWRLPYPFQAHETVNVTQLRSKEVGRNAIIQATGLRDSSMLTQDENIVDIRFTVQYRLKDARAFLFENRDPEEAVTLAAESAVREIVGRSRIDSVLYEQRDAIAADLVKLVQTQLDRLKTGILVINVNLQSVQPPEQVQAAFEDTLKAGQDGDRAKKEGLAYASDVIPKAQGSSASAESMRILPTTSRTALSAACTTASCGFLLSKRYARASFRRYCTANLTSTMFSSSVSIADSFRPVARITLSRPTSTERICVTNTSSWRWIGYGRRQLKPAPTVDL